MKKYIYIMFAVALLTACGSTKNIQNGNDKPGVAKTSDNGQLNYVRKVNDNAVYAKNIVSKIDLEIDAMGRNITVDGKVYMRRDEVIRLVISPLGLMEVGRLEFTPDYVMIVNRLQKEYTKVSYNDIDFLKNNGINFYTLQSLFWNQFFVPGKKTLADGDLAKFKADMSQQSQRHVTRSEGQFEFDWTTEVAKAIIKKAQITFGKGTSMSSTMVFDYDNFTAMGSKTFPANISLTFNSAVVNNGKMTLRVKMGKISDDAGWEAQTQLTGKYTEVKPEALMAKLMSM